MKLAWIKTIVICFLLGPVGCGNFVESPEVDLPDESGIETKKDAPEPAKGQTFTPGYGQLEGGEFTFEVRVGQTFPQTAKSNR